MGNNKTSRGKIIVFGILFWYPLAGVTYQFLHYLLGLRRLGYDPYYVEDSGRWVYDPLLNDLTPDASRNVENVVPTLQAHGFGDRWCFRGNYEGGKCYGLSEAQLFQLYREADAFLNVTGAQEIREEHLQCPRRIYVESDPFAAQVKADQRDPGTLAMLSRHDMLFSFGENLGSPDCLIPAEGYQWSPTRQPVACDLWMGPKVGGSPYTTITTWHNKGKDLRWNGDTWYWTKDREFEKFLELPSRRPTLHFELAATVDPEISRKLHDLGWTIRSSVETSRSIAGYHSYIQNSRAEFTVARDQYVRSNSGWFSDRSACYLAAGRPVITQETGFSKFLPTGKGLFAFKTLADILTALDSIESDYAGHCQAARDLAAEYFDAEKVLAELMQRAGL